MLGFVKSDMSDHELAIWLRQLNLLDKFRHFSNSTQYVNEDGVIHVVVIFDNWNTERVVWVRERS